MDAQAIRAVITPADDALPGDTLVDIAVVSSVSGQGDRIVNQVTVNEIYDVKIIDNQSAQASPGGIVDILHTISNEGNVAITDGVDHRSRSDQLLRGDLLGPERQRRDRSIRAGDRQLR